MRIVGLIVLMAACGASVPPQPTPTNTQGPSPPPEVRVREAREDEFPAVPSPPPSAFRPNSSIEEVDEVWFGKCRLEGRAAPELTATIDAFVRTQVVPHLDRTGGYPPKARPHPEPGEAGPTDDIDVTIDARAQTGRMKLAVFEKFRGEHTWDGISYWCLHTTRSLGRIEVVLEPVQML